MAEETEEIKAFDPTSLDQSERLDVQLRYCPKCNAIEVRVGGRNLGDIELSAPQCSLEVLKAREAKGDIPDLAKSLLKHLTETYEG